MYKLSYSAERHQRMDGTKHTQSQHELRDLGVKRMGLMGRVLAILIKKHTQKYIYIKSISEKFKLTVSRR
jgi:hypothetical protein